MALFKWMHLDTELFTCDISVFMMWIYCPSCPNEAISARNCLLSWISSRTTREHIFTITGTSAYWTSYSVYLQRWYAAEQNAAAWPHTSHSQLAMNCHPHISELVTLEHQNDAALAITVQVLTWERTYSMKPSSVHTSLPSWLRSVSSFTSRFRFPATFWEVVSSPSCPVAKMFWSLFFSFSKSPRSRQRSYRKWNCAKYNPAHPI